MSSDRLRENLDAVAEAAGGVARLRELILQLAVQGKLVEQDPKDEPATMLVERINRRRLDLEKAKIIRRRDLAPPLEPHDCAWQVPMGWVWVRLGDLCLIVADGPHFSPKYVPPTEGVPFLSARNVTPRGILLEDLKYVSHQDHAEFCKKIRPEPGDILYTKGGTTGIAAVHRLDFEFSIWVHLAVLRTVPDAIHPEYLGLALNSPHSYRQSQAFTHGTGNRDLGLTRMILMTVPVPPLAEQKRIVAKVGELMALCDELEQKQEQRHTVRRAAHTSALEALTNAQTPDELAHSWERLQKHWDVLAAHADAVPPLRQAILQLAVQGSLTLQNSLDEPASTILDSLHKIREKLGIRSKRKSALDSLIKGFILPANWSWTSLDDLAIRMDAGWSPACQEVPTTGEHEWGILKTTAVQPLRFLPEHHKRLPTELAPRPEFEVHTGDLLVTRAGPWYRVGICCFVESVRPRLMLSDKIIRSALPLELVCGRYVALCFAAGPTRDHLKTQQSGMDAAQMNISQDRLRSAPVPLPPIAEQKRIVARVDELMALCDSLEQRAREQETLASQLAHAAVAAVATG